MKLKTRNFGEIVFDETREIIFEKGIPGFRELQEYIMIEDESEESVFSYLQSIQDGNISFIITNPYYFDKNYAANIKEEYLQQLGETNKEYSIFSIVTILDKFETATINLVAPLVIHNETKKGIQVILEGTAYTTRHKLVDLFNRKGK